MTDTVEFKDIISVKVLIAELRVATTRRVLLNDISQVVRISEEDSDLGRCAKKYIDAHKDFVAMCQQVYNSKVVEAANVINPLLSKLFKTTMPGPVTLPVEDTGKTHTCIIKTLEMINVTPNGEISGIVGVSSLDNVCHTTEGFYIKDGEPYFRDDDIY
jgi:hypothetical protein